MKRIFLLIIFATSCFFLTKATDYYVDATTGSNTTGDGTSGNPWQTITYALSQITGSGHTIYAAAGTYDTALGETFPILMKNGVSLVGAGMDVSIIDANSTNSVIKCISIVDTSTKVEGFTIKGGYNSYGGGIYISAGSTLKITGNKIADNVFDHFCNSGAGIYMVNSSPVIINNIFTGNKFSSSSYHGSAIYASNSSPLIKGNRFTGNSQTAGSCLCFSGSSSYPKIINNLITNNSGTGIYCTSSSAPRIINNTISDNSNNGIYILSASPDSIFNNIISLNSGYGISESGSTSDPGKVWYNLFYANSSGLYHDEGTTDYYTANSLNTGVAECDNNIDGDPMFVDRPNGDYNLQLVSPAIDAGDPDQKFNDPDGSRNDIGALPYDYPPAMPQNLSATTGAGEITLRWNPNTEPDLDQYNIYRDLSSPAITLIDSVISTSPPDTFYVDTGLIVGQDYFYRITALDTEQNESDFSNEINAVIPFDLYTDSLALVALYDSTNGAGWTDKSNWFLGNVSTWYGITVSGNRVTTIDLNQNNLTGTIPPEIGNLGTLNSFSLVENQLTGSIPTEIGNLTQLQYLNLWDNQLSGSIPTEISNLTNLNHLQFGFNQFTGLIPSDIGNITNLPFLSFCHNQLTGPIPAEIGNLTNLTELWLYSNQLSGSVPSEIGNLISLQILYLNHNQFTDLPDLSVIATISEFNVSSNQLTFKDIEPNISVATNFFYYSPQDSIGEIIDTTIYIGTSYTMSVSTGGDSSQYQWKKDEVNIGTISGDSTYTFNPVTFSDSGTYTCKITNTVATDLTLYSRSVNVSVEYPVIYQDSLALIALYDSTDGANWTNSSNWHIGNVSTWYGITVSGDRVTEISLINNNLVGTIPIEIGNLTNLTSLILFDNILSGSIPTEIGNLINLTNLNLHCNNLSGSIPIEIGNLINLTELDLFMNQLTGSIPTEIGNLISLTSLDLNENQFTGSIPNEIGNLTNLTHLGLYENQLSGSIPSEIGNLINLTYLGLHINNLSGSIPSEIGNLTQLPNLLLYNNKFTDLPNLSTLSSLDDLQIQNNQFTFKDIEPNIGVASTNFTYSPQDSIGEIIDTTIYIGTSYTMSVSTGGDSSQYQWKKDEVNIGTISGDSTYTINSVAFSDTGAYTCEITNTVATDLTLYSRSVNVSVEYPVIYQDSLALIALYDSTDGANWTNSSNWHIGNVSTWYGITVSGDRVTEISLINNNLVGTIPIEIGNLTNLTSLILFDNILSGSIPTEIGNLINLTNLNLHCNNLSGSIPIEIGNLINLTELDLFMNQLTGSIPSEIGNLTNLTMLRLEGNQLNGLIPTEIGNLVNLAVLVFENNQFTGSIPPEINNLTNLQHLHLFNNEFTDLPDLSSLDSLDYLSIENNRFTFEDIEPNIGVPDSTFTYSPQDSVGEIIDTTIYIGTSYTMSVSTGGDSSQYQWKKDEVNIGTISGDSTYTINPVTFSDSGTYTCVITNTVALDLTLYSRPVNVSVPSTLSSENDILSFSFAEQTGAATIDAVSHTVDIEVVYGTNLANLVASFSISSQASMTISSVAQISGVTANDFTNSVTYTVTAEDGSTQDWIITANEAGIFIISDFPYSEDFESGNGGWRTGGTNSSWQLGNPTGPTINSAAIGTVAWVTNLAGDYNSDEISYVLSPQFDLLSLNFPKIVFSIWWDAEGFYDGANLQYKLGSDAWKILGKEESDDSWYNSSYIYSIEKGFGLDLNNSAGWTGDGKWGYGSDGWVTVSHALTGIGDLSDVKFRIAFASNSSYQNDGVAFDDINIYDDPTRIDAVNELLSHIQIYPNPNEGKFWLVYNGKSDIDLNLQLINLQGQVILLEQIKTGNRFSKEFDLEYLPPGLYYFRLMHKEGVVVKKMVVK